MQCSIKRNEKTAAIVCTVPAAYEQFSIKSLRAGGLMVWFRLNLRWNSWIALIVLAIQLSLTFAHVVHDQTFVLKTNGQALFTRPPTPTQNSNGLIDLYCPLCAAVRLSSAATTSSAPVLPLPDLYGRTAATASRHIAVGRSSRFASARGPPLFFRPAAPLTSIYLARIWSRATARSNCMDDYQCEHRDARIEPFRATG